MIPSPAERPETRDPEQAAARSMTAIGTIATVVVTHPPVADEALALLGRDLARLDDACSRFRTDSELARLEHDSGGRWTEVSPLLFEALEVACVVAVQTAGTVDPTIGGALVHLGYDRDFAEVGEPDGIRTGRPGADTPSGTSSAPGWWRIELDPDNRSVRIPVGVHVDLGATAKAWAADRSARRIAERLGCGALVNLGGDVAVAGPGPEDGWAVGIAEACTSPLAEVDQVVTVSSGGLATSGTTARSWTRNGRRVHHIVDPWTGAPADPVWTTVSTAAPTCVEANAWSTAAVVWGDDAVGHLSALGVPARLVDGEGRVTLVAGWPESGSRPGPRLPFDPPRLVA
jgi:thiamine biosynthesis lipoprotein